MGCALSSKPLEHFQRKVRLRDAIHLKMRWGKMPERFLLAGRSNPLQPER